MQVSLVEPVGYLLIKCELKRADDRLLVAFLEDRTMKAEDRLRLEKALWDALRKFADSTGPGKHTVWKLAQEDSICVAGLLVYRATMSVQTPIVIWVDDAGDGLHLTLVLTNSEGKQTVSSREVRDVSDLFEIDPQVRLLT